jgi:hypothetical protein
MNVIWLSTHYTTPKLWYSIKNKHQQKQDGNPNNVSIHHSLMEIT